MIEQQIPTGGKIPNSLNLNLVLYILFCNVLFSGFRCFHMYDLYAIVKYNTYYLKIKILTSY